MAAISEFWRGIVGPHEAVSKDFEHMLMREVMRSELMRVRALIIGIGVLVFGVPVLGNMIMLALLSTLFITTNLSIGYTFSTIVQNQLQAMQLSMMFFLPSILLSGFMFPFLGMPLWAQYVGEGLPLTHYLRIVRAIMLKGSTLQNLQYDALALFALMLVAMTVAVTRFRRTLD